MVDERIVRTIAAQTVGVAVVIIATGWWPLLAALAIDFLLRASDRGTLSPLAVLAKSLVARISTEVVRPVAGRPKRFAAGIGATLTLIGAVAGALGIFAVTTVAVGAVAVAALLEAAFGLCLGCEVFARLAALGVIEECPECNDLRVPSRELLSGDVGQTAR